MQIMTSKMQDPAELLRYAIRLGGELDIIARLPNANVRMYGSTFASGSIRELGLFCFIQQ